MCPYDRPALDSVGYATPIRSAVEGALGGIRRIEVGAVYLQRLGQRVADPVVGELHVQFREGLHQVEMSIRALVSGNFDRDVFLSGHDRRPVGSEMLEPSSELPVVGLALQHEELFERRGQRRHVLAGSVIFHQGVDHKRLAIDHLVPIGGTAGVVGHPVIAAVLLISKVLLQKLVALPGGLEVIALRCGQALAMGVGESPDHARLPDQLLGSLLQASSLHIVGPGLRRTSRA